MSTLTNLIAYWRMDEASGAARRDSVGGFDLAASSGVSKAAAKLGAGAAVKDASGNGMIAATGQPADFSTNTLSMAGWLKIGTLPTSGTKNYVCALNLEDGVDQFRSLTLYFDATDDTLVLDTYNSNTDTSSSVKASTFGAISAATWYHVVLIWTGSSATIAVNTTTDSDSGLQNFAGVLTIDSVDFGSGVALADGFTYDDWGVWDEEISATDISDLYNSGSGAVPPGLGYPGGGQVAFFGFHGF